MSRLLRLLLPFLLLPATSPATASAPAGYLDVTTVGADPTGLSDSTAALQAALNAARDAQQVLWFPAGTYLVSDRLVADQGDNVSTHPFVLMGSTVDPTARAVIRFAPGSPGFQDPANRRAVLHFLNLGTPDNESGNTNLYDQAIIGVDFQIMENNPGAVGLRLQGAEGCTIQDVTVDLTAGGHTGIWGIPASGGATHGVTVRGGEIGLDTRKPGSLGGGGSQPQPVVTGSTFLNQRDAAIVATVRGSLVLVGCRLERDTPGPVARIGYHWVGQPFDGSLQLVDCVVEYTSAQAGNTVIAMLTEGSSNGRSFLLDNTYVRQASRVWSDDVPAHPTGWMRFRTAAVAVRPTARSWGQPAEPIYVDGAEVGDVLVESVMDEAPPTDLQSRHQWPRDFPSWESPGAVNVLTAGVTGDGVTDDWAALQALVDAHEIVFFPPGEYLLSRTLDLRPTSKLIGSHHRFTRLRARATLAQRFGTTSDGTADQPIVRTADTAAAETFIAFLQIRRTFPLAQHNPTPPGNYALEWRSGGHSVLRQVELQARVATQVRPDLIARHFYGYDLATQPVEPNHPQRSLAPGQWAWPCAEANVQVRGNGGGRWFNFWMHGRQALREHVPFLLIEGTRQPLHIYHLHAQQQDSASHVEVRDAHHLSIYGTKGEIKGAMVTFENCRNVRLFGHSGLSSPDPDYRPPHLFRFLNCDDFQISGLGDTIEEGASRWVGGVYDRWIHANLLTWQPLADLHDGRADMVVPSAHRPMLYRRGNPVPTYPASGFQAWGYRQGQLDEPVSPLDVPARDGVPALLRYALGADWLTPASQFLPKISVIGQEARLWFRQVEDPVLTYAVFTGVQPGAWETDPVWSSHGAANRARTVEVQAPLGGLPGTSRFFQVRVSAP